MTTYSHREHSALRAPCSDAPRAYSYPKAPASRRKHASLRRVDTAKKAAALKCSSPNIVHY